ncbi:MAG: DNA mismatch endonuclease Vsr, partial [Bacteroidota bacterium]
ALFKEGFRYRLHWNDLPGKPDIVLPKYKTVIFVHGCFWHGHDCQAAKLPATRFEFWEKKINENKVRDKNNYDKLTEIGWNIIIVWQCSIKNQELLQTEINHISNKFRH